MTENPTYDDLMQFYKNKCEVIRNQDDEIVRLTKERDELFATNGDIANTIGADAIRLRMALVALRNRDDQNGSLPKAYREIIDTALATTDGQSAIKEE